MLINKIKEVPTGIEVIEKINEVIDGLGQGGFEGYWTPNENVSKGDVRYLTGRNNSGYILECVSGGTTGSSQPIISEEDIEMGDNSNINSLEGVLSIPKGGTGADNAPTACVKLGIFNTDGQLVFPNGAKMWVE